MLHIFFFVGGFLLKQYYHTILLPYHLIWYGQNISILFFRNAYLVPSLPSKYVLCICTMILSQMHKFKEKLGILSLYRLN